MTLYDVSVNGADDLDLPKLEKLLHAIEITLKRDKHIVSSKKDILLGKDIKNKDSILGLRLLPDDELSDKENFFVNCEINKSKHTTLFNEICGILKEKETTEEAIKQGIEEITTKITEKPVSWEYENITKLVIGFLKNKGYITNLYDNIFKGDENKEEMNKLVNAFITSIAMELPPKENADLDKLLLVNLYSETVMNLSNRSNQGGGAPGADKKDASNERDYDALIRQIKYRINTQNLYELFKS